MGKRNSMSEGTKVSLSYNVPFYDEEADVIVLELTNCDPKLLRPLKLRRSPSSDEVNIFGYPSSHNKSIIIDPRCQLIKDEESIEKTKTDIVEALKYWEKKLNTKRFNEVKDQYSEIDFSKHEEFPFFHCSDSTTRGASGSPGLTLKTDENWPTVELIYTTAYPGAAYHEVDYSKIPRQYMIEMGVSTAKIYDILSTEIQKDPTNAKGLRALQKDIFYTRLETDME